MKITKFLNIDIEPAPPEMELEIEMQCREIMKANDLQLTEVPIIVYCYDKECDAGHHLANELFRAGFTNVIDYKEGILGYLGRTRYKK